jgi:ABC-type nitrate/sulfonate/bicarbonate transport system substrate-binding protein
VLSPKFEHPARARSATRRRPVEGSVTRRVFVARSGLVLAGASLFGVAACGSDESTGASSTGGEPEIFKGDLAVVAYHGIANAAPIIMAVTQGFFTQNRLEVTIEDFGAGADAARATASGSRIGSVGVLTGMGAYSAGLDQLRIISPLLEQLTVVFLVRADSTLTTPADLKGKTLGVQGATSVLNYLASEMLKTVDLTLDDVETIDTGAAPDALTALENKVVDCCWGAPPLALQAAKEGRVKVFFEPSKQLPPMTEQAIFADAGFIQENPDVVKRYVDAIDQGKQFIKENTEKAAEIYSSETKLAPDLSLEMLQIISPGMGTAFNREGIENNIRAGESLGIFKNKVLYDEIVDEQFTS